MNYRTMVIILILLSFNASIATSQETKNQMSVSPIPQVWQKDPAAGINEVEIKRLVSSTGRNPQLWAATDKGIYSKHPHAAFYLARLNFPSTVTAINDLFTSNQGQMIYVATNQGLYQSINYGTQWQKIYDASDDQARNCLAVLEIYDQIIIATGRGIFYRTLDESDWLPLKGISTNERIHRIVSLNGLIYAAGQNSVYEINLEKNKVRVLYQDGYHSRTDEEQTAGNEADKTEERFIYDLIAAEKNQTLVLLSVNGIQTAQAPDFQWNELADLPVHPTDLTSVAFDETSKAECLGKLSCIGYFISSRHGVHQYQNNAWKSLNQGFLKPFVNDLSMDEQGNIYAATSYGIYQLVDQSVASVNNTLPMAQINSYFQHEPTIQQVQQWAIEYADVAQQKIESWKRLAKKKALYPSLSIGADGGRDWDRGDSIYGSSSSGGTHYIAPDNKSHGEDIGFDIGLSWDLADWVWSTDQTTIDSRSKLMVELRENILDQVTRLYFERRRLQIEMLTPVNDDPFRLEKEIRIDEITALLDGYTAGKYSQSLTSIDRL